MSTEEERLVEDLRYVYEECERAERNDTAVDAAPGIADEYNDVLSRLKEICPDNERIQETGTISASSNLAKGIQSNPGKVSKMKTKSRRLARELGAKIVDGEDSNSAEMGSIETDSTEVATGTPEITINNILTQNVNVSVQIKEIKKQTNDEETKELIEEYRQELEEENPDASRLKRLYSRVANKSDDIALQLGILTLKEGIDIVQVGL